MNTTHRQQGFTLLEVVVALGVGSLVAIVLGQIFLGASRSMDFLVRETASSTQAHRTLTRMRQELKGSRSDLVFLENGGHRLRLQMTRDVAGTIELGAFNSAGEWLRDATVVYEAREGDLFRTVVDSGGQPVGAPELIARHLDLQEGFTAEQMGPVLNMKLLLKKKYAHQSEDTKTMVFAAFLPSPE